MSQLASTYYAPGHPDAPQSPCLCGCHLNNSAYEVFPVARLQELHKTYQKGWKESQLRTDLLQLLDSNRPGQGWGIKTATCLATGSFSKLSSQKWQRWGREKALIQFAVFMDVVGHIQAEGEHPIRCLVEDIAFNDIDKAFLRTSKIQPGSDGNWFSRLKSDYPDEPDPSLCGKSLFMFEPFLPMDNACALRDLLNADPGLYIGTGIGTRFEGVEASMDNKWSPAKLASEKADLVPKEQKWRDKREQLMMPQQDVQGPLDFAVRTLEVWKPVETSIARADTPQAEET